MKLNLFSRRKPQLLSALFVLVGTLTPFAWAQSEAAPSSGGFLSSLFSMLGALALLALIVGVISPNLFRFLFKEKTSRKRVGWTFAGVMIGCSMLSGMTTPRRVVSSQESTARSAQAKAEGAARLAENRAKAAEARAAKAEKAAASAEASSAGESSKTSKSKTSKSKSQDAPPEAAAPRAASPDESLPSNVAVLNVPGVGKRQIGEVDNVGYVVISAETTSSIGSTQADGTFYVLRVAASNSDKKTHNVTTSIMKLLDDQDREFDPSREGGIAQVFSGDKSAQIFSAQVQPGVTKQFTLVYDAPGDATGLKLKIPAGGFGFGQSAVIKVPTAGE